MPPTLELHQLTFGYAAAARPLFDDFSVTLPAGWTGIIGANGAGKSTLLELVAGRLTPGAGHLVRPGSVELIDQRTDAAPAELPRLLESPDSVARRFVARLGLAPDWPERWGDLSHGERKRAQLAVGLWRRPAVLALDEPTNHVDVEARSILQAALQRFGGVGLVVSHDRALVDALCGQCLFLGAGPPRLRPGGLSAGLELEAQENVTAQRERDQRRREQRAIEQSAHERAGKAAQADRRRSKRGIGSKDHDAKARIDAARVSGKDGQAGRQLRQLGGRRAQAQTRLDAAWVERRPRLGLSMRGQRSPAAKLWSRGASPLVLGDGRTVALPELALRPDDRIGICGANGAGKSTLLAQIIGELELSDDGVLIMPQELDDAAVLQLRQLLDALPSTRRGAVLAAVDALGSDPERILETDRPSPGEARKLLLALGLLSEPVIVIMDEPTNHLDLPSMLCLERALTDCRAALLLVSHDESFLTATTTTQWRFETSGVLRVS